MNDFYVDIEKYINNNDYIYDSKCLEYCNQIYKTESTFNLENYDKFYANYNFYEK